MSALDTQAGYKHDAEKLRYDLIPPEAMEELAKVLTHGATKYEDHNWARGMKWGRVFSALMRHMWSWWKGENVDPETGYSHLSHALCNLVFLVTYEQRKMGQFDDRFVGPMYRAEIRPWDNVVQKKQDLMPGQVVVVPKGAKYL
ncbi:MAG: hypothetical protein IM509_05375 [Microcystis sp. M31BS1]|uniref:dATP/dGTP diphosphohydrolase domain-containing protein n=1 Tax=Microcystis sp. M31BS1 TaxID=2771186 RepID=UPI0025845DF5|nr:dATP/dGTP diphosphohydrolase domain-containing protein [Microcystis sp. M31BS1]MCA2590181.1 hypothetical protein [Microcystis sp. M31BS1]